MISLVLFRIYYYAVDIGNKGDLFLRREREEVSAFHSNHITTVKAKNQKRPTRIYLIINTNTSTINNSVIFSDGIT